jgi:small subunit ribosomal protein S1
VNHPSEILSIGDTVPVKVLDIDRDRHRISLGLKQTQEDPWQRVVDTYNINDELEGKVTKVVTFGAFVEILDGVEGLVHISELAHHHVENPREVVEPGATVKVKVLEIDSERRRLSLSIKRVAGNEPPPPPTGGSGSTLGSIPDIDLSDDMFAGPTVTGADDLRAVVVATSEDSDDEQDEAAAPEASAEEVAPAGEVETTDAEVAAAPEVTAEDVAPAAEVETTDAEAAAPEAEVTDEAPADDSSTADDSAPAEGAAEAEGDAPDAADASPEPDES